MTDHPEMALHILGAGGEYAGTCKKSRKPKKGKCKPGFEIYDRPLDNGKFEKCCFRLFNDGQNIAEYMVSLQMKKDEISKRGKTFHELLVSGDYKNTVFTTTKNGKTKEYRFTEKTLRRKIRSLQAKYKKVEALAEKKKTQMGLNNFTDDTFLAMKGAIATVKEENRLSGGGLFEDLIAKGAAAKPQRYRDLLFGEEKALGGGFGSGSNDFSNSLHLWLFWRARFTFSATTRCTDGAKEWSWRTVNSNITSARCSGGTSRALDCRGRRRALMTREK